MVHTYKLQPFYIPLDHRIPLHDVKRQTIIYRYVYYELSHFKNWSLTVLNKIKHVCNEVCTQAELQYKHTSFLCTYIPCIFL